MPEKNKQNPLCDDFFTALSFLTIIPVRGSVQRRKDALASSMFFFPLVGFGIAAVSLGLSRISGVFLSQRIANLLLVLFPILLSGCLHMDGFADFFDAFFQKKGREEILRVMKDPHIGVWGVVGVVFCILLKWECLMIVPLKAQSFLLAMTLSRWAHVFLCYLQLYAGQEGGLGEAVAKKVGLRELMGSTILTLPVTLMLGLPGLFVFSVIALFVLLSGRFYKGRIGGITGDLIGATGEMSEIIVYMVILSIAHFGVDL